MKRLHKLTAWLLTLAMLMTLIPSFTLSASAAESIVAWNDPNVNGVIDSGESEFASLSEAITAVSNSTATYIRLNSAASFSGWITISDKEFTVDMNGHKLHNNGSFDLSGSAKMTVTDTGETLGEYTSSDFLAYVGGNATLIIEKGNYNNFLVDCYDDSNIIINGGTIDAQVCIGSNLDVNGDAVFVRPIEFVGGFCDFSDYENIKDITLSVTARDGSYLVADHFALPNGMAFYNAEGNAVDTLEAQKSYTIDEVATAPDAPAAPTTYTVSVSANPTEGGAVTGGGTYEESESATVTATPNDGYKFVKWTENDETVSTEATYTFIASADRTLTANFAVAPTITDIVISGDGVIADPVNKTYTIPIDETITVTVSGTDFDKITDEDYANRMYSVVITAGGKVSLVENLYNPETGNFVFTTKYNDFQINQNINIRYSTDGGDTYINTGWKVIVTEPTTPDKGGRTNYIIKLNCENESSHIVGSMYDDRYASEQRVYKNEYEKWAFEALIDVKGMADALITSDALNEHGEHEYVTEVPEEKIRLTAIWSKEEKCWNYDTYDYTVSCKNEFIVTFNANGGTCETASDKTVDGKFSVLPTPTLTGYKFEGWFDAAEGGNAVTTDKVYTENTTIYAHWTEKQTVTITEATQTYTYDDTVKEFQINGITLAEFTVKYQQNGQDVTPKNAGIYDVVITRDEDDNYKKFEKILEDALVIEKANAVIEVDTTPIVKIYGEAWTLPTATTNFGTVSADKTIAEMANVGEYTVTYTVVGDDNFNGATKTVNVTIDPKPITGAIVGNFAELTYTGEAQTPNASVTIDSLTVTGTWSNVTNVSDKTTFTANGNFTGTIADKETGMAKADPTYTEPTAKTGLVYNGSAQELLNPGTAEGGTMKYFIGGTEATETVTTGTSAGEYTVKCIVAGDENHNNIVVGEYTVTIAKKTIDNAIVLTTPVKNSAPQTEITGTGYTATVVWSPEVTDKFAYNTEYTATVTITPDENHTITGIAANGYTVEGAKTVTNDENSNVIIVAYEKTGSRPSSGGGTTRYTVRFETNGGTAVANKTVTGTGEVTEPTTPTKDGFTFEGWYTDKELTTVYDFDRKVTKSFILYAKWNEVLAEDDDNPGTSGHNCPSLKFSDLDISQWYHLDADYVIENDIFRGTTETTFTPNGNITRAMMITVLYRSEGEPEITGETTFLDIDEDAYYARAVIWGQQNGIIKGYSETEYAPEQDILREQIAAIMHRYAQYKGYDIDSEENTNILSYDDFDSISEYAIPSMQWAVGSGMIKGRTESTLNPEAFATRVEIAAMLHRFIENNK